MAEQQILGFPTKAAPNDRITKDSETFELLAVRATFDGSAAGASFVPAVVIVSDAGEEVGTFPLGGSVAAGDTVAVTFAPFLRNDTGLSGIFYDIDNVGGSLDIKTTDQGAGGGFYGYSLRIGELGAGDRSGDTDIEIGNDNNEEIGNDYNLIIGNDFNVQPHEDFNLVATRDVNLLGLNSASMIAGDGSTVDGTIELRAKRGSAFGSQIKLDAGIELYPKGDVTITLSSSAPSGTVHVVSTAGEIFRIDPDGQLHGKIGKTLAFDL